MKHDTPILVTGAHRTGTTWVGKMLAAHPRLAYISEPLNVLHRPGVFSARVERWYTYITRENENEFIPAFRELFAFRYHPFAEILSLRSSRDFLRMGRDMSIFFNARIRKQTALLKDPFAAFSLNWFAETLDCKTVVTVRHPAGFASSLKKLNWPFDFKNLLDQSSLMRDHLETDRAAMESMPADDIIGQASLLWRMLYRVVHSTRQRRADTIIVRHEDLSLDPVGGYKKLYKSLGLEFTPAIENVILNSSSSENPSELSKKKVHSVKLDSRANLNNWKKRLSAEEIARVRNLTEEVASIFYPEEKWQ